MDPQVLGDYHLTKKIGQGSLGTVWLAEHHFMKKQHAIKVLPQELAQDRSFIQRFEENIAYLAALDHPHIVKIHNISYSQGSYFLVFDCIVDDLGETTNLSQWLLMQRRPLDEELLYSNLSQIADAIDYIHDKKVGGLSMAHGGIKLNNILVGKGSTTKPCWYLTDSGLAPIVGIDNVLMRTYRVVAENMGLECLWGGGRRDTERFPAGTATEGHKLPLLYSSFLQNYLFLAPEQKQQSSSPDLKSDFYAFGILTYYLLMGQFPEGLFDMPSARYPHYKNDWDLLLCHCLNLDPEKRCDNLVPLFESISSTKVNDAVLAPVELPAVEHLSPYTAFSVKEEAIVELPQACDDAVSKKVDAPLLQQEVSVTTPAVAAKVVVKEEPKPILAQATLDKPITDLDPAASLHVEPGVKFYKPEKKENKQVKSIPTEMVVIRAETYWRGSRDGNRDEQPRHQVHLSSYAVDIHPVTNEQFVRFLEAMGGDKDSNNHDIIRLKDSRIKRSTGRLNIESGYAKHPVVGVTWYGAVAYAKWVGKRLPTEAEWEVAAGCANESFLFSTGEDVEKTQANFFSSDTTPVMSYAPSSIGLYDIAGNVYEWCYDWYGYNYYETSMQEPDDPTGPLQGNYRVLRGGCWKSLKEDLRVSRRHRNNPGTVNSTYGFRCAADAR